MSVMELKARELCAEIESLPASELQTKISLMAADLRREIWELSEAEIEKAISGGWPTTQCVVDAIRSEREHQERRWPGHSHRTGEWILIMEKCLNEAKLRWVTGHGDNAALHEIRQVVTVGIAAMEQCGAPKRGDPIA